MTELVINPSVSLEFDRSIAKLTVNMLAEHSLASKVCAGLIQAIATVATKPELEAVVLFWQGADELVKHSAFTADDLQEVLSRINQLNIPVLSAMPNTAMGDMLEEQLIPLNQAEVSPSCKAGLHVFFAERNTANLLDINNDLVAKPIKKVAVIGAGTMGSGIAMCFANAAIPVVLLDATQEGLDRGLKNIAGRYHSRVQRGRISAIQQTAAMALIHGSRSIAAIDDSDLIIEAVFEDMALKKAVFTELDKYAKAGAILATNTSTFDINDIAAVTNRPQQVIGLHFFSPANIMPLVEVVRTDTTDLQTIVTAMNLVKAIGKTPVLANICYGFIGNRMMEGYAREADLMALEGAKPSQIDGALTHFGMAMGILAVFDMAGIDVSVNAHKANAHRVPPDPNYYQGSQALFDAGRLGQKNGKGYYQYYSADRQPIDDQAALEVLRQRAESLKIPLRLDHTEEEIVARCIYPLLNEAFNILDEGIAEKASDIDVVWTLGYGFPRTKGGPLYYAEHSLGLKNLYDGLLHFQRKFGAMRWRPAKLLEKLVKEGLTIAQWQGQQ